MKFKIIALLSIFVSSSAFAEATLSDTEKVINMELTKDRPINPEDVQETLNIHPADDETEAEIQARNLTDEDLRHPEIIEDFHVEPAEEIKQVEIETGSISDPTNYPAFEAHMFTLDFKNPRIPVNEIMDGGIVVDEVPALVNPLFLSIQESLEYLQFSDKDYMAVIEINGDARAYPLSILNWHQGVNDVVGGQPVFVAYDPLSGNIMAMDRRVASEKETTFGVTGQVYNSASLYYDRATKSIWSAYANKAVTGALSNTKMKRYEAVLTTWKSFKEVYPNGIVLDIMDTGYERNYKQNPYGNYALNNKVLFDIPFRNKAFPRKEYMVGVHMYKNSRRTEVAIPVNMLLNYKNGKVDLVFDQVEGFGHNPMPLTFEVKEPYGTIAVYSADKDIIVDIFYGYWFVWSANNPNTRVITELD